jgi:predicted nucleotidyltransferase
MFYQGERLTELGTRLRFFLCTLLEDALSSLLPHVQVIPFGSSVNGFGKHTSDLDMILDLGKTPSMVCN